MAHKDYIHKSCLSVKTKIDDIDTVKDQLYSKLKFYCSVQASVETDKVYDTHTTKKGITERIKLRNPDSSLKKSNGRTIIKEQPPSSKNDFFRATHIQVDPDVSSRRFHEVLHSLGRQPDYIISKERMTFSKEVDVMQDYRDIDLHIYLDSKIDITDINGHTTRLPDAFLEFQILYKSDEEKEKTKNRLLNYVSIMDMTVGSIEKRSYTDMAKGPKSV